MRLTEMAKMQLTDDRIGFMLIIEIAKIEFTDGHIGFMLILEIASKLADILSL